MLNATSAQDCYNAHMDAKNDHLLFIVSQNAVCYNPLPAKKNK